MFPLSSSHPASNADACYAAIDIGASSGRVVVGRLEPSEEPFEAPGGKIVLDEVYRFPIQQVHRNGHDCWDVEWLFGQVVAGLRACAEKGWHPQTIGIDTWGVDYVLLDGDDRQVGDAVSYRDHRTDGVFPQADALMSLERLYEITGIQRMSFNTVFQLLALKNESPEQLKAARSFLMIPDYLAYRLTGVKANEYTNATTTGMLDARSKVWSPEVLQAFGLPERIFQDIVEPGTLIGNVKPEVAERIGYMAGVVLPATHDTGSAFVAVPAKDAQAVYLSSGTWSLLGVENASPVTNEAARLENFTNEGGYDGTIRFLKNIMGLWMIQCIRREFNGVAYVSEEVAGAEGANAGAKSGGLPEAKLQQRWGVPLEGEVSFPQLSDYARKAEGFPSVIDVNDERFLAPGSMIDEICACCADTGQQAPRTIGELMQCVYSSLASCYARAIEELTLLTGTEYTSINIVGGGCQDTYLNERTAKAAGIPVYAGPVEGTALGNLAVQMIADGALASLADARATIGRSFPIEVSLP